MKNLKIKVTFWMVGLHWTLFSCETDSWKTEIQEKNTVHLWILKKVYGSVLGSLIWKALNIANTNIKLINTIKAIYYGNRCRIKFGNKLSLSESFITCTGLLHGYCLSSTLFKIYIDVCLREWRKNCDKMSLKLDDD